MKKDESQKVDEFRAKYESINEKIYTSPYDENRRMLEKRKRIKVKLESVDRKVILNEITNYLIGKNYDEFEDGYEYFEYSQKVSRPFRLKVESKKDNKTKIIFEIITGNTIYRTTYYLQKANKLFLKLSVKTQTPLTLGSLTGTVNKQSVIKSFKPVFEQNKNFFKKLEKEGKNGK